jgi:hypothetical protein
MAYDCEFFFCETLATFAASQYAATACDISSLALPPKAVMLAETVLPCSKQPRGRVDGGNKASN